MPKVVLATYPYSSFDYLSDEAKNMLKEMGFDGGYEKIPRHNERFVKFVETLGDEDRLLFEIEEVADKYYIDTVYGSNGEYEWLITPENLDWISSKTQ